MRILVCGSRSWTDKDRVRQELGPYENLQNTGVQITIVHGGARGADKLAGEIAKEYGFDVEVFPAKWGQHGISAGLIRNIEMLETSPDVVIAFWDGMSKGTNNTITEAKKRFITTIVVK
jgi:hypothetical protein